MDSKRSLRGMSVWVFALFVLSISEGSALAQNTGTILGTVKDQTGAVLPGASISIRASTPERMAEGPRVSLSGRLSLERCRG